MPELDKVGLPLQLVKGKRAIMYGQTRLDDYDIHKLIATGGYGRVYKAQHKASRQKVAIKQFISASTEGLAYSIIREVATVLRVKKIDRFNQFVEVLDIIVDLEKSEFFFVMEFAPENLQQFLERAKGTDIDGKISTNAAADLLFQIFLAIDVLHSANVLHRDIKLENILVMGNGKIKICDFGLAKAATFRQRRKSDTVCTQPYRAPEVCLGESSYFHSVDSWSMGCVVAEVLMKGARAKYGSKEHRKYAFFDNNDKRGYFHTIFSILGDGRAALKRFESQANYQKAMKEFPETFRPVGLEGKLGITDAHACDLIKKLMAFEKDERITMR